MCFEFQKGNATLLKTISIPSSSTYITERGVLVMSANKCFSTKLLVNKPRLFLLPNIQIEECITLAEFAGKTNSLLQMAAGVTFLGLDNKLLMSEDLSTWKNVLETENQENVFWHMAEAKDRTLFVQEYGKQVTGIYRSIDGGETWRRIVNSREIDRKAQHFHTVAYDQYRDLLVTTLGDGCLARIAISKNHGDTWEPIYSPYQYLPVAVTKEYLAFGMDSGIGRGVAIWNPSENKWHFIHLKYVDKLGPKDPLQAFDLKLLSNGVWLMSTGHGSLLSSGDLRNWRMIHTGEQEQFEVHMISNEKNGIVTAAMDGVVMVIDLKALNATATCLDGDVKQYYGFVSRIKGLGHMIKMRTIYSLKQT